MASVVVESPPSQNGIPTPDQPPRHPISQDTSRPRTIDELMRGRAQTHPDHRILAYPDSRGKYVEYTYRQLDAFAFQAAKKYAQLIPQRRDSGEKEKVVGLLGPSNLNYLITLLALSKLGHTVLFLSTRISNPAYESLLKSTSAACLLIHPSFTSKAEAIRASLPDLQVAHVLEQVEYETSSQQVQGETRLDHAFNLSVEARKTCWIIHSSGSTGLPKPVFQTHSAAIGNYSNHMNMRGFVTLPLFHNHGLSSTFRAFYSLKEIHMYNADLPLTSKNLLKTFEEHDFEMFLSVPYALKVLGETEAGIKALARLKLVMFGGSPCPDVLGNRLVDHGVNLASHYGSTETGQLLTSLRPSGDRAWNYLRFLNSNVKSYIHWEPVGENIFELVVLPGLPTLVTSNRPDGAYATKDLFTPHPTIPDAWKYFARADDTIVLLNGEKAVPIDMEMAVRQTRVVQEAVVFGTDKPQLGLMVIPQEGVSEADVMTEIWPVVQKANTAVPAYAQIASDMIKFLPAGTKYPSTDKGTVIRQAFYKAFSSEIENSYSSNSAALNQPPLSDADIRQFIRENVSELLTDMPSEDIQDSTDFFSVGMDSLQSSRLRGSILKKLPIAESSLGMNIAFEFPSIDLLTAELSLRQKGDAPSQAVPVEDQMRELIEKYDEFPAHVPQNNSNDGEYLVITGATGSLGAHLVAKLAAQPNVKQITCLVRAKSTSDAYTRVVSSMRQRAIYHQMTLNSLSKIVAIPADFSKANLGLTEEVYNEIAQNITSLIHCAWSVNFNLKLSSFEKDCIAGSRHLILLCLAAHRPRPAKFTFCSSVSAVVATPGDYIPEALPESLRYAQNMGYAQSKLVTEHLVQRAASKTGILARVVRVGQIIGDTVHGRWNATEAIPMMLQAGITIGAIPALDEHIRWLPVDIVAQSLLEISSSDETPPPKSVLNLVAPFTAHWTRDLLPQLHAAGLKFEEPGQKEWISKLRNSEQDPTKNPPIKLLEFFAKKYDNDNVVRKRIEYATDLARKYSPALAATKPADQELINKIISNFLATSWKLPGTNGAKKPAKVVIVTGPCGSGKTTIATAINSRLHCPYVEGDDYHDAASLAKMTAGIPLSDSDRWAWLERLKDISSHAVAIAPSHTVLMTCSALKSVYRDKLRHLHPFAYWPKDGSGSEAGIEIQTTFVLLQVTQDEAKRRVGSRKGHYMGIGMVDEQMKLLELPGVEEVDVLPVDAGKSPVEIAGEVIRLLEL